MLRLLLFSGILSCFSKSFAQQTTFYNKDLYDSIWYLNGVELGYFGYNDTVTLFTSNPSEEYLQFKDKMVFQSAIGYSDDDETAVSKYYWIRFDEDQRSGYIVYTDKRRDLRRKKNEGYYDFFMDEYELKLYSQIILPEFKGIAATQVMTFSKRKDSLEWNAKIMGHWKQQSQKDFSIVTSSDTMIFAKSAATSQGADDCLFNFYRNDGQLYCKGRCLFPASPPENPYYWYLHYSDKYCVIDLKRRQLVFTEENKVFDILELTESSLILKLHQEN